ncbi:hypothetical protein RB195_016025 [Necator americanus]
MRCLLLVLLCITVITCEYASVNRFKRWTNEERCNAPTHLPGRQCLAYFERYTYIKEKNICEMFIYGGCRPSPNNFSTLEKCQKTCVKG